MIGILKRYGLLRVWGFVLAGLPLVALPVFGFVWLLQGGWGRVWCLALVLCAVAGYWLHRVQARRERDAIALPATLPDGNWPPSAAACWAEVENMATQLSPDEWPLDDVERLALLGRDTLERVARCYYPGRERPLLELTVPHALVIVEKASRELRQEIVANVPFSHRLTLANLCELNRWRMLYTQNERWFRIGRVLIFPETAVFSELRRAAGNLIMDHGLDRVKRWLLQEYVRKVGYHAIELYSGQVLLGDEEPGAQTTGQSVRDRQEADAAQASRAAAEEPLRILLLGRSNVGKSSLVNALFGQLTAATDALPGTTDALAPYRLLRDGHEEALIFDPPGCDSALFSPTSLQKAVSQADLILWVSAANRPDRQPERECLDQVRAWFMTDLSRRPPPLLGVLTHIDRLRPPREWSPPYDLRDPDNRKAANIAAAVVAAATDLALPPESVIPVCLAPERVYNVDDTLWAAILNQYDEAARVRYLRCLKTLRHDEDWRLVLQQLKTAGRYLLTPTGWKRP